MNYRTTCPKCASVFRLGADQLGAAAGWVQCSVCGAAFDARPSLLGEDGSPLPTAAAEPAPPRPPPSAEPPREETPRDTPRSASDALADVAARPAGDDMASDHETPRGISQRDHSLELDSIILIDPDAAPADDPGPLPQIAPAAPSYPAVSPPAPTPKRPAPTPPAVSAGSAAAASVRDPGQASAAAPVRGAGTRRSSRWIWAAGSVLLFVTLLAQTAFFLRDTVVSHLPQTRPAFERVCAAFDCTLSLPKDLAQLQIVGSDLQTEASGRLKLALTLGNRANHVQAWPVLVLTLTDQRDRPLTRRSFAPSEYLGDAERIAAGIAPRSEEALSLPLTVHGPAPMGFDLQLTY